MDDQNLCCQGLCRTPRPDKAFLPLLAAVATMAMSTAGAPAMASSSPAAPDYPPGVWQAAVVCEGAAHILKTRHPREADIQASRRVVLGDTGYAFTIPRLPGDIDPVVMVVDGDTSRGVTDHVLLLAPDDLSPPSAAVVVTELPESLRQAAPWTVIQSAVAMQVANGRSIAGLPITFTHLENQNVAGFEMLVPGRTSSTCFPTSHFRVNENLAGMEVTHVIHHDLHLIEISLLIPPEQTAGRTNLAQYARDEMRRFTTALVPRGTPGLTHP